MNDVIKIQTDEAKVINHVEYLVQRHIVSEGAQRFFEKRTFSNKAVIYVQKYALDQWFTTGFS